MGDRQKGGSNCVHLSLNAFPQDAAITSSVWGSADSKVTSVITIIYTLLLSGKQKTNENIQPARHQCNSEVLGNNSPNEKQLLIVQPFTRKKRESSKKSHASSNQK